MKVLKVAAIALLVYAGLVVGFESLLGVLQPERGSTLVITTFDRDGTPHDRVVARLESDGKLYVSANHWPRSWYRRALANQDVRVTIDGEKSDRRAVPVTGEEAGRVAAAHPHGIVFRILTGFPPRRFLRLDPHERADAP
jgi:F420H(2)-dependent quinone reductase